MAAVDPQFYVKLRSNHTQYLHTICLAFQQIFNQNIISIKVLIYLRYSVNSKTAGKEEMSEDFNSDG